MVGHSFSFLAFTIPLPPGPPRKKEDSARFYRGGHTPSQGKKIEIKKKKETHVSVTQNDLISLLSKAS